MLRSGGGFFATEPARVSFNSEGDPKSISFEDGYYSSDNGIDESRYVFIDGNRLESRFEASDFSNFTIGELGFGTGLNFLLASRHFLQHAKPGTRLHYWSVDRFPLTLEQLAQALARWGSALPGVAELLQQYPPRVPGHHRRIFAEGRITLDLVWADAEEAVLDLASFSRQRVNAWFLDGFAPQRNDRMWSEELLVSIAQASSDGATVATYTAATAVRRALENAGFVVEKRDGFGRKRECIRATLHSRKKQNLPVTPWDLPTHAAKPPSEAVVIGAGLSGSHIAAALARRGVSVRIVDAGSIAGGASGNLQGTLFTRLSPQRAPLADFSLQAFSYAQSFYRQLLENAGAELGSLCGSLQFGSAYASNSPVANTLRELPELGSVVDADEAGAILGVSVEQGGLWLPNSGWLSPPAVCSQLLQHPGIECFSGLGPITLATAQNQAWSVLAQGREILQSHTVIVAAGLQSNELIDFALPIRAVRGQCTNIPTSALGDIRAVLCHKGYIAPATGGVHCIGATFAPGDAGKDLRIEDHRFNIERLSEALPSSRHSLNKLDIESLDGRAEVRCVSPDYLPMVGPVANELAMSNKFSNLKHNARRVVEQYGEYVPGLYVSTAHGSRGLSYAAYSAEHLASEICGELPPMSRELHRALSPARFAIRDIIRSTD